MATKKQQVLDIDPADELKFTGPFSDVVSSYLRLSNPSDQRVCFKVKTTAPKRYCVRPNSGFLDPGDEIEVTVMLQPRDPDIYDKGKHKFMVQSLIAPPGANDIDTMWQSSQSSDFMDSKLKCVFEGEGAEDVVVVNDRSSDSSAPTSLAGSKASVYNAPGQAGSGTDLAAGRRSKKKLIIILAIALIIGAGVAFVVLGE